MSPRTHPSILLSALACLLALVSCRSLMVEKPTNYEALQDASDAFLAYERGDCETVLELTEPRQVALWEPNEILHSTQLLSGFCKELAGDTEAAREIYDALIANAPTSFAAQDAKERSRILRINESDPTHAAWIRDARDRALAAQKKPVVRVPIERRDPYFPPLARSAGVEGYAVVEFGVTPRGKTSDPIVIDSSPPLLFDGASVRAVRNWEYTRRASSAANDLQIIRLVFVGDEPAAEELDAPESKSATDAALGR